MAKIIVWGAGNAALRFCKYNDNYPCIDYEIVGVTDSYKTFGANSFCNYRFYDCNNIPEDAFDTFCITADSETVVTEIKEKIKSIWGDTKNIYGYKELINKYRKSRLIQKYNTSYDPEIMKIVNYLRENELSVRTIYENKSVIRYDLKEDDSGYPYVMFFGKKMFYPKDCIWRKQRYIENIVESDQHDGSPHLYLHGKHNIKKGDVVVDAGVCEGNFALRFVDVASKMFLIECDPAWWEPLERTFFPYKDKVEFVFKELSDIDSPNSLTIDSLIPESQRVDFIKMDIEGCEVRALLGGINTLRRCHPKVSVCAYHRQYDEKYIRFILDSVGYSTSVSDGYMFMMYDRNIDKSLDLRRGMVYGDYYRQ